MYINKISIQKIRSIRTLEWCLPESRPAAGWHVIIGDNGSGKTSFLRSIALAMIGPTDAAGLRLSWDDWLRRGQTEGRISLGIQRNPKIDKFSERVESSMKGLAGFGVGFM